MREVCDRLHVRRALLAAEGAVEVRSDHAVARVAGELADVIDVIEHPLEGHAGALGCGRAADPVRHDHPGVERRANHRTAVDQLADLIVGELAVVVDQRAAVRVARPDRSAKVIQRVAEAVVAQVGRVEDDAETLHLAQQLVSARAHHAGRIRPLGVDPGPVVGGTDGAEPLGIRALDVPRRHDGIARPSRLST